MKPTVVELFAHAADRAKDVAVMMDAARALTVLGRARLSNEEAAQQMPVALQVVGLYHTAERLGEHVRQVSSEARSLLLTAKQMLEAEPSLQSQVPRDFQDVCSMMDEAMGRAIEAIERLEAMRLSAAPSVPEATEADDASDAELPSPDVLQATDELLQRLRRTDR